MTANRINDWHGLGRTNDWGDALSAADREGGTDSSACATLTGSGSRGARIQTSCAVATPPSPSPSPTPRPTPKATPVPVPPKPTGVTFTTDSVELPGPTGTDEITYQATHTVRWKAPRTEGVEIRVYGGRIEAAAGLRLEVQPDHGRSGRVPVLGKGRPWVCSDAHDCAKTAVAS